MKSSCQKLSLIFRGQFSTASTCYIVFALLLGVSLAHAEECNFNHLVEELPIFTDYTTDVTSVAIEKRDTWDLMKNALPNVKRVFTANDPYFLVLLGWGASFDRLDKFSRDQLESKFSEIAEVGQSNASRLGQDYEFLFSPDDPFTMYVTLNYIDGGEPYRDVALDVIATPKCVVSMKISGKTNELGDRHWAFFDKQINGLREILSTRYGGVQLSEEGSKFWLSEFVNLVVMLAVVAVCAWILSVLYRKRFILKPGSTTRKYSVFIMALAVIMVTLIILYNESLGAGRGNLKYENIVHFGMLFAVHLWAYLTNRPSVVAFAIGFVFVSLLAGVGFWLLGWVAFKTSNWIGIAIGGFLVTYTLIRSSELRKKINSHSNPNS